MKKRGFSLGSAKPAFGLLAVVVAVASIIAPDLVSQLFAPIEDALQDIGDATLLAGLMVLAAGYGLVRKRSGSDDEPLVRTPPESTTESTPVAGHRFDSTVTAFRSLAILGEDTGKPVARVRAELVETAASSYARTHGVSADAARTAVETGDWTTDRVAAGFLAQDSDAFTIIERIKAILIPDREFERRTERTITAIESLDGAGHTTTLRTDPGEVAPSTNSHPTGTSTDGSAASVGHDEAGSSPGGAR